MKPHTRTVRKLFQSDVRYVVPLYQRSYVWSADRQWQPLWEDIEVVVPSIVSTAAPASQRSRRG